MCTGHGLQFVEIACGGFVTWGGLQLAATNQGGDDQSCSDYRMFEKASEIQTYRAVVSFNTLDALNDICLFETLYF